ncbi:hypothetical protein PPERSA_00874 [Pseudocohnilembus persalinus]|uniref:Uncharacterized protein n=1 Tax=Pseudocohnilembus persalinus TaxID=266149 RepID=A0A0V0QEL4_PSEPJ|nr:hypothetical protein PPERSA_00874 [Pseudocohnilembus persalinus]|eukprot:KRX00647.1 hypothetical protein PPERSA_00874 [Pseudocohnilembus persalinus]
MEQIYYINEEEQYDGNSDKEIFYNINDYTQQIENNIYLWLENKGIQKVIPDPKNQYYEMKRLQVTEKIIQLKSQKNDRDFLPELQTKKINQTENQQSLQNYIFDDFDLTQKDIISSNINLNEDQNIQNSSQQQCQQLEQQSQNLQQKYQLKNQQNSQNKNRLIISTNLEQEQCNDNIQQLKEVSPRKRRQTAVLSVSTTSQKVVPNPSNLLLRRQSNKKQSLELKGLINSQNHNFNDSQTFSDLNIEDSPLKKQSSLQLPKISIARSTCYFRENQNQNQKSYSQNIQEFNISQQEQQQKSQLNEQQKNCTSQDYSKESKIPRDQNEISLENTEKIQNCLEQDDKNRLQQNLCLNNQLEQQFNDIKINEFNQNNLDNGLEYQVSQLQQKNQNEIKQNQYLVNINNKLLEDVNLPLPPVLKFSKLN